MHAAIRSDWFRFLRSGKHRVHHAHAADAADSLGCQSSTTPNRTVRRSGVVSAHDARADRHNAPAPNPGTADGHSSGRLITVSFVQWQESVQFDIAGG
jgi:hypothetical protein